MRMRTGFALLCVAALLAGCSGMADSFTFWKTPEKPVRRDLFPASFKAQILRTVPSVVSDRAGIHDAYYSDPVMDPTAQTYASCVRFNARDSGGQYVGVKDYIAYYYNGELNQFVDAEDRCKAAAYKPFPELENLCPRGKCS